MSPRLRSISSSSARMTDCGARAGRGRRRKWRCGGRGCGDRLGSAMNVIAGTDGAGGDLAGEAAEVLVGAEDELDRQPEGACVLCDGDGQGFEQLENAGAGVERHAVRCDDDVFAFKGADGNGDELSGCRVGGREPCRLALMAMKLPRRSRPGPSC